MGEAKEFHILFNRESGPVEECYIVAESFWLCETLFQAVFPDAVYWEIGTAD